MDRLSGPLADAGRRLRRDGLDAVRAFLWRSYLRYGRRLPSDSVFDADWDLLVVLSACRADLWAEVVDPDGDVPVGTTRVSPGGTTDEWIESVVGSREPSELADVGYVTARRESEGAVDSAALGVLEEVWRDGWDDAVETVRPRSVTDAAIRVGRSTDLDRLIVHYGQPQFPSLADVRRPVVDREAVGEASQTVWDALRTGRRSRASIWASYGANLRVILDDVRLLLSNVDADRAVITADHGVAVGERGLYGDRAGLAMGPLREVPWAVTAAADGGAYDPVPSPSDRTDDSGADAEADDHARGIGQR